ncbi:hypothetical protein BM536_035195 [Streptomyces phaeoluteigriseus]|uniref:Restriction endonuclease domain-containing protein n=1 Tax=Streptomyces phaeoluteigriseus TaxID=114686 RepID=A0A1V6MIR1_9ACTN|nr:hypothetical protein BM536_035195 [Streptomyces phaeoluteigriseus]
MRQRFVPCSLDGPSRTAVGVGPDDQPTTWIRPEDLVLAVEVVSADSVDRDREVKPRRDHRRRRGRPHRRRRRTGAAAPAAGGAARGSGGPVTDDGTPVPVPRVHHTGAEPWT